MRRVRIRAVTSLKQSNNGIGGGIRWFGRPQRWGPNQTGGKKKCPEGLHHGCHWRRRKNLRGLTPSVSNTMGALWKEGENTRAPHWAFLRSGEVENFENLNNSFPFFLIWGFGCGHKQKWAQKFPFKHFEDLAMDIRESCLENQCNVNLTACFDTHWRK